MTLRLFQAENSVFGKTMKNKRKQRYQTFNNRKENRIIIPQRFYKKCDGYRNDKNSSTYE